MKCKCHTPQEYLPLIEELCRCYPQGEILLLRGDLGSGKTTFTKEFAKFLGVTQSITSPTFGIMNRYEGATSPLFHYDVYNKSYGEFMAMGLMETFEERGWHLVEWGEEEFGQLLHLHGYSFATLTLSLEGEDRIVEVTYA